MNVCHIQSLGLDRWFGLLLPYRVRVNSERKIERETQCAGIADCQACTPLFFLFRSNMSPRKIYVECALFDMDGTLVDTTPVVIKHWEEYALDHDLDVQEVSLPMMKGVIHGCLLNRTVKSLDS